MYQASYFRVDGTSDSDVTLPKAIFNGEIHEAVLHQVVTAQLANQRQGTAKKKNRSAVRGGSRKPWRQKGTGRARQGTIRAVQWRGGGLAFPPQPHSWRRSTPKRVRRLARHSALNSRAKAGRVAVIEGFDFDTPRTKRLAQLLQAMNREGKVLFLTSGINRPLYLSSRNLAGVRVRPLGSESPLDIVWSGTVVIEEAALECFSDSEAGTPGDPEGARPDEDESDQEAE